MTNRRTPHRKAVTVTASALVLTVLVSAPLACTVRSGPAPAEVRRADPAGAAAGETARTDAGLVRGTRSGPYRIFRGIPYAGAPEGRYGRPPTRIPRSTTRRSSGPRSGFPRHGRRVDLELVGARTFGSGVVHLRYRVAR
ncbi:hypothetical protein ACFUIT_26795 [Streptomyces sp. NPDC057239]|uniref:hypothetical protein n=1 Tax=Streptomyces sp. NPDC057239 TaxID=3346061 RepID=UPI003632FC50